MAQKKRSAAVTRKTTETAITVRLALNGTGDVSVRTGIGILDHMLVLFGFHGFFDLSVAAKGDLNIDIHHTNEDIGIVLGQAFKKALGTKKGIRRFGFASVPMEEVLAQVSLDICGRGHLTVITRGEGDLRALKTDDGYQFDDAQHFFESFVQHLGVNMTICVERWGTDLHAVLEPVFKAFSLALDEATQFDARRRGIPSTKGVID